MASGGKRAGAGRKRSNPPTKKRCVCLTDDQVKLLRMWGRGDVSAGLRWLIDAAKQLVRRTSDHCDTPPSRHHQLPSSP